MEPREKVIRAKDLTGKRYGSLVVLERAEKPAHVKCKFAFWLCACDCGKQTIVRSHDILNGHTKSCGHRCIKKYNSLRCENPNTFCGNLSVRHTNLGHRWEAVHGMTNTRLYEVWEGMKQRCYNKNHRSYKNYGGRGIEVCEQWRSDFMSFYNWATENGYDENAPFGVCTIDRINGDGNYQPTNCRWASFKIQNNNQRGRRKYGSGL